MSSSDPLEQGSVSRVVLKQHGLTGRLIAICGTDGAGKSTAIKLLATALAENGPGDLGIVHLQQPSPWWRSDPHVKRTILKKGDGEDADEFALGVFGVADRLNQQVRVIEPALAAGHTVLMDRYVYCLLAYFMAKHERQLGYLTSICEPLFQPDLTFILDCPPQVAVDRVVKRDGPSSARYDQQLDRITDIVEAYRYLARNNRLHLLSSLEPPRVILAKMVGALHDHGLATATS